MLTHARQQSDSRGDISSEKVHSDIEPFDCVGNGRDSVYEPFKRLGKEIPGYDDGFCQCRLDKRL